jgi:hypothetical protein
MKFTKSIPSIQVAQHSLIEYLEAAQCQQFLYELKKTISITATSFAGFYLPVIVEVTKLLQHLPDRYAPEKNIPYGLIQGTVSRTLMALKLRRNRFLPVGHDAETGYAQADHWTYAIFVCALMRDLWKCTEFNLMVNTEGSSTPVSFEPLTQLNERIYISAEPKTYHLNNISNLALVLARIHVEAIEFLQRFPLVWEQVILHWHHQPSMIDEFISSSNNAAVITAQSEIVVKKSFATQLSTLIVEQKIPFNEKESAIQGVSEGVLLVMPDFLSQWQHLTNTVLDQASFLKQLEHEGLLIKSKQANLHTYYQGQGFSKVVYEGYLLDKNKLTSIITITINDALHRE